MSKWIIALTVMLPTLIEIIDTSVVNVALDHIRGSLSAGIDESTWTITSYLVSNAIIIPMTGWLSRLFGRKRYLIFSISLFTLSSLLCGSAWSLQSLIFFRILQGLGGGALQPISQSILLETFPQKQHGMAMAIFGVGIMFGPIIGPLLGGWITDNWSWHWIFFINIPIGIVSILMTVFFITDPPYMKGMKMKIDYWGLAFLAIGLGCLQIALDKGQTEDWFSSGFITWLTIISVSSLILFVIIEFFAEHPIVNLRAFKSISFSAGNVVMFLSFFNLFGSIVLLPIFLQTLMGYTATLAGVVLGPGGIATLIAMPVAGMLVTKMNPKLLLGSGIIIAAYSTYLMSLFNLSADFNTIIWPRVVLGVGMGFLFIPLTTMTMANVKKEDMANASAIYNLLRNLGGSFGVAFITTMIARRAQFHQVRIVEHLTPFDAAYQAASSKAAQLFQYRGVPASASADAGLSSVYHQLLRQASMLSFNDAFYLLGALLVCTLPLVLFMKTAKRGLVPGDIQ
ncbi:MAG: EmrB/QacA family drug resistance transporter [Nitrospirae bacterium CG_4_10_14_3_um_filter_44_29]|nr:MAG: EmrB/QacA family drug resistance transporter [Nitrospirae bacterium CG02_land_8_20_14_3_00_44_33]PIV66748.1 MAG: EmrB/QacA family drug resistance transporter [Nitrospirae bacterium CG01_land_8_20_14_3_00_44_22]PIW88564.1 MAG: EmrB/QacA family drug resistance transporter [Nitrospirae bacterium CG_4_8_14_3_um_filter_44_28]PIX89326.1 MAG: EmrB/QacA family drug resistance transporter [Nitrospirae bacterium CG_4_10_14_3_um_filter_44_29]